MQIKRNDYEKLDMPVELQDATVTLFVASKKSPRLKRLDLTHLTAEQRANKLHKWAKDNRFVAVIEKGDLVYALASPQFAESLRGQQDLTIEGKAVTVKALTEEQASYLSSIGESFEEYVRLNPEEGVSEDPSQEKRKEQSRERGNSSLREYFASKTLLSDLTKFHDLILKIGNIPDKVKLAVLKKLQELQIENDRRKKEETKKDDEKKQDIKFFELKKRITKEEQTKYEIQSQHIQGQNHQSEKVLQDVKKKRR